MKYFYRIKIPKLCKYGYGKEWEYKPFDIGYIDANSKIEARKELEKEYDIDLKMRVLKENIGVKDIFLLQLYEPNDYYDKLWTEERQCLNCDCTFTRLARDKANDFKYIKAVYCSEYCELLGEDKRLQVRIDESKGLHRAVIYKITNKINNKCYIGKTTQPFTLRWYQHFFQAGGTKFHEEIRVTKKEDWCFEIVETLNFTGKDINTFDTHGYGKLLSKREQYYINKFNSISDGYNTATSNKEELK